MPSPPLPVLVIGEAIADVVCTPDGRRQAHPGGSPANTALGLARLGHAVHLATRLGGDEYGRMIRNRLVRSGVLLTRGSLVEGRTATATAVLDERGRAEYAFDIAWSLPPEVAAQIGTRPFGHLHTGSIAALLAPGADEVLAAVRAARPAATVSYDPNLRPALLRGADEERPRVEALVSLSDVVKVSDEDLAWLHPGADPAQVAASWARRGPSLVVLTRGAEGASAFWRHGRLDAPGAPVEVADTIGAGDAFMSGLISGLLAAGLLGSGGRSDLVAATSALRAPDRLAQALDLAVRVASFTCGRPGADPPTRAELSRLPA